MIVTSTINLSSGTGKTATNAYLVMTPYVNTIKENGQVPCDLEFYFSEADADAGSAKIYPISTASLSSIITNTTLTFAPGEVVKVGANCTMEDVFAYFETKLAAKLLADYGWTVTV